MRLRTRLFVALLGVTTVTVTAVYARRGSTEAPEIMTAPVTRGSIVNVVSTTGTVEAVTTVEVGSQVSGTVALLNADFNSIVRKGQVLARLEPSLFESAVVQARANLARAEADAERTRMLRADADAKLRRTTELAARQLVPAIDLDTATVNLRTAQAQVRSAEAAVAQARAALNQAQVNLSKTVITSPIDGIVVSRNVDAGQTVSASLSAPTLFLIAADLTRMQVNASIDESDIGQIAPGQPVTFTADAYPGDIFAGVVEQVRLNPTTTNNVVTYAAIVSARNDALRLKPGMTVTLSIEIARRDDVLRVSTAALRFKPSAEVLAALGAPPDSGGRSTVWRKTDETIAPVTVRTGVSDGAWTELVDTGLAEGTPLVTRVVTDNDATSVAPAASTSPLMGSQRRPR